MTSPKTQNRRAMGNGRPPGRFSLDRIRARDGKPRATETALGHPILSLPAVSVILVGFLVPLGVLIVYTFFPTDPKGEVLTGDWTLSNYTRFFTQDPYIHTLLVTFLFVGLAALLTVILTFPFAYYVAFRARPERRLFWLLVAVLPFGTSYLIRVFAWLTLFGDKGLINDGLQRAQLISAPLEVLDFGRPAIVITFIYLLFPLTFLSTYITLERIDPALSEVASDLGARSWRSLLRVTLPLAKSGLLVGFAFAFIEMAGDYVTPSLIGGTEGTLFANLMINQFGLTVQWGFGATLALMLLVAMALVFLALRAAIGATTDAGAYTRVFIPKRSPILFGYALAFSVFLYVPIVLLVLFAFNDQPFVGFPMAGLTTHWFSTLASDGPLISALLTSLQVAAAAVGISLVLGTLAAGQLARTTGRLRNLSVAAIGLPLLLPPVVLALGLLIALNALDATRGLWTIIVGHTILILPVVTLLILVRLEGLDQNLELAAMDLGARPWQTFLRIAVPQAVPGIVAAALVGFVFSMDEFILTFLVTGSQTTLPLYIYGALRFRITPELNALSALIIGASLVLVFVAFVVVLGRDRLRRRAGGPALGELMGGT
jgi:ABC-type spermidine/putrescine transport system permease subunit II